MLDAGEGLDCPILKTLCKIQINSMPGSTSGNVLQDLCGCEVDEEIEIELGKLEGDISHVIDVILQKMKRKSTVLCSIKFHDHSLFMSGQTISFKLSLISWKECSIPIYNLKSDVCFNYALENKETGTKLFKQLKPYAAASFYSQAIKYLIVATASNDLSEELQIKAKDLLVMCHVNLAACLLKYELYPEVIANCNDALKLQGDNIKALYRRAVCFLAMNDLENAKNDISVGLKLDHTNKALLSLSNKLKEKIASADATLANRLKSLFA